VDFSLEPGAAQFRESVRSIIREHLTAEVIETQHRTGTFNSFPLNKALADAGLLARAVPGFSTSDPIELWILFNELEKAGAPADGLGISLLLAGVINRAGTQWQKDQILPSLLAGTAVMCMGYSEADHGSDLPSISTRAVRDGTNWIINGAKLWTTMAQVATWALLLTRTGTPESKHRGLTMFLVPLATPGITIRPVYTMATERTNATFYDNVELDDAWRIGGVDQGWDVMAVALALERGVMGATNPGVALLRHFRHWAEESGSLSDHALRRMALVAIDNEVAALLTQRSALLAGEGKLPGVEGSMTKVFATEAYRRASHWFQEMAAPASLLGREVPGSAAAGWIDYDARHNPVTTIYGGTSEINRNNVAQRYLGLPHPARRT
jgi:3-oxocholest-4-en-26-oyl-CoA dehydrogenase alpha subunit